MFNVRFMFFTLEEKFYYNRKVSCHKGPSSFDKNEIICPKNQGNDRTLDKTVLL